MGPMQGQLGEHFRLLRVSRGPILGAPMHAKESSRRAFLAYLAASPLLLEAWAEAAVPQAASPPASAADLLSVMDFEPLAHQKLPPAHWGYMASGVDDDLTLKANIEAYKHVELRVRRLVDVSNIDLKTEIFGVTYNSPIFLCPVGGQRMFHPEGEVAAARAAKASNALQVLSTQTSIAVEDVAKARGTAPWYQLYLPREWADTEKLVKRVEAAGCPVLVWTVDNLAGRNLETAMRFRREDGRDCTVCHSTPNGGRRSPPMFAGLSGAGTNPPTATWDTLDRLRALTSMKLVVKGLETREDAKLALDHGADGILVSNHGGRATESLRPTIDALPEVVDAVGGRIPVMVDGGIRRGSDVFKALAYGARAVGIGRPYVWGLAAFGEQGVTRVLDILRAELTLTMRQCGTPKISQITRGSVARMNWTR